jgi:alpha-amylase/alpha-mannosidase (GH57 family)
MAARLLDANGRIVHMSNNYRHMSFNVGPTLHRWIERRDPQLSAGILKADISARESLGEGGAIAQAYNHMIMPLACDRDVKTQVRWGVKDFEHRFGRKPAGMWLPETAVDTASLEALAAEGIKFTILAPYQCAAICSPGGNWVETPGGGGLDVTRPYEMTLPSGRNITLVFYYGSIAHDIAFGGLLDSGDFFAESLLKKLPLDNEPRLLAIATDGESYGHHHHFGEMALARAAQLLYASPNVMLTNVGAFLKLYPAKWRCKIAENTSWSCAHGVERWRSDCGCHTGGDHGWNQAWRAPLREALDRVRDRIDEIYEREMARYCDSPWALRDDAISLYLDDCGEHESMQEVMERKASFLKGRCGELKPHEAGKALALLEAQRMRMFMYTSCGWFFNDISGIETRQIIAYAIRAIECVAEVSGVDLEKGFMEDLKKAKGNATDLPTGYDVAVKTVIPNRRSIRDIAAAASLLKEQKSYYAYRIERDARGEYPSASMEMSVSTLEITDTRTLDEWKGNSIVITTGGLDDVCRLSEKGLPDPDDLWKHFYVGDIFSISKFIEGEFEHGPWHFSDLTADDRHRIAQERTSDAEKEHMEYARQLLEDNQRLLVQLNLMNVRPTSFLAYAGEFVYARLLDGLLASSGRVTELLEPGSELEELLAKAHNIGIKPNLSPLAPAMGEAFYGDLLAADKKNDEGGFRKLLFQWRRAEGLGVGVGVGKWMLQNAVWGMLEEKTSKPSEALLELAGELGFALPEG